MTIVAAIFCLLIGGSAAASEAGSAIKRPTHIPAQRLEQALQALAKEHGLQMVYRSEVIGGRSTQGAVGELTTAEALVRLLDGTGLTYRYLDERMITIVPRTEEGKVDTRRTSMPPSQDQLRLAMAETLPPALPPPSGKAEEQEIVVIGTNIRGVYPASSPVQIYTAEDIARTGATTTEQFIGKLPQNLGTRTHFAPGSTPDSNSEGVNSVDLRGLGVGTTLTLLNGRRLALAANGQAADISMIPMGAIERVEVLSDGASAIYGSDAIGGVINFVLREDFTGAQTRLGYGGVTSGELSQKSLGQTFGYRGSSGNVLLSYDFLSAEPLKTSDRVYAAPSGPGNLSPDDRRHSVLLTGSQRFSPRLKVSGDFNFSRRDIENLTSNVLFNSLSTNDAQTKQYFANIGLDYSIGDSLDGAFQASYSKADVDSRGSEFFPGAGTTVSSVLDTNYAALDLTAKLDGSLFSLPAGAARFSVGGGYLDEQYSGRLLLGGTSSRDLGRATSYVFGEVLIPLTGAGQNVPLVHRLELNIAGRYTRYDDTSDPKLGRDFGDGVSPKVGLLWALAPSFSVRATYGESFRAPSLVQIDPINAMNQLLAARPVAGVSSTLVILRGPSPQLDPEEAESFTVGFDYRREELGKLRLGATYFSIDYTDRIAAGTTSVVAPTLNPAAFTDVIYRPASAAQVEEFLRSTLNTVNTTGVSLTDLQAAAAALFAQPQIWILDVRLRNLSLSRLDGVDLNASSGFDTAWGEVSLGAQFTRIFDYEQRTTPTTPARTVVDTVLLPVDLRGRGYLGLTRSAFAATASVNYVDDYTNPFAVGGSQAVASWTTVDLSLSYDLGQRSRGLWSGLKLGLSAQNVLDRDPPFVALGTGGTAILRSVGFDPANANPLGRFLAFSVEKRW